MLSLSRAAVAATTTLALAACGGGGGGSVFNPNPNPGPGGYAQCTPGTSVTIARPQSGAYGVSTNIGTIEIVLSGNSNPVWQDPSQWTVALQSSYGGGIVPANGTLSATSDPSGPHPYSSDFYLDEGIGQLQPGVQYNVYLQQTFSSCSPVQIGQFST